MSYRERPDIYGPELNAPNPKAMRWAAVAIISPNLGQLFVRALKHYGFHASREVLTIGVVLLGATCVAGGIIAYRQARRSVARHVAELTGPQRQHGAVGAASRLTAVGFAARIRTNSDE